MWPCKKPPANKSPAPVKSLIARSFLAEHSTTLFLSIATAPLSPVLQLSSYLILLQN